LWCRGSTRSVVSILQDELEDVECLSIRMGVEWVFFGAVGFVEEGFGAWSPVDASWKVSRVAEPDGEHK
jgi:hypothetical protein